MADNKKYYYIRLKDNFFDSNEIVLLESMQDGYLYSNILLKLYLRSLKDNGKLMFNDRIPYNPQMIATITRHQVGTVEKALQIFKDMGLIEILDNGAIYMLDIQQFIGQSSTEADRIRNYRNKINTEKLLENNDDVQMYDKCTPEIELEKELELKKKKEYIAPSDLENHSMPVVELILKDDSLYPIYKKDLEEYQKAYPKKDILQELRKMKLWLEANPKRRKTKTGIKKFIVGWLARGNDKPQEEVKKEEVKSKFNITKFDI